MRASLAVPDPEPGPLTAISLANTVAASLPEHAIVADEANTSGFALPRALTCAARHSLLTLTGGSIGQGLPAATGAAVAAPDRPVLCLEADGSALYTIQALWTQAREQLNVTTVLINNAAYAILRMELARTAAGQAGERAARMLDLSGPTPDFTAISTGLGVPAVRVTTAEDLDRELRQLLRRTGPAPDRGHRSPDRAGPGHGLVKRGYAWLSSSVSFPGARSSSSATVTGPGPGPGSGPGAGPGAERLRHNRLRRPASW